MRFVKQYGIKYQIEYQDSASDILAIIIGCAICLDGVEFAKIFLVRCFLCLLAQALLSVWCVKRKEKTNGGQW